MTSWFHLQCVPLCVTLFEVTDKHETNFRFSEKTILISVELSVLVVSGISLQIISKMFSNLILCAK